MVRILASRFGVDIPGTRAIRGKLLHAKIRSAIVASLCWFSCGQGFPISRRHHAAALSSRVNPTRTMEMLMRLLITFCIGVAVTLAWQSYGDAAKEIVAKTSPRLGWLAPKITVAQRAPATVASTTSSPDPQELKAMSADLAAVRQKLDQLAAQVSTDQNYVAREFANKLQIATEDILDKISVLAWQPTAARVRKSSR